MERMEKRIDSATLKRPISQKHRRSDGLFGWILCFVLLNLALFFIITSVPKVVLTVEDSTDYKSVNINIKKLGLYPLRSLVAKLDDEEITLSSLGAVYSATLIQNGTLEVVGTNLNGMQTTIYENITSIDTYPPDIYAELTADKQILVSFEDALSGVDIGSIYALDADSKKVSPSAVSDTSVLFDYAGGDMDIYVYDKVGNEAKTHVSETITDSTSK